MKKLLLLALFVLPVKAAVLAGALRINTDTTGTNTKSSAITVTLQTNLLAGSLTSSNIPANKIVVTTTAGLHVAATNTGAGSVVLDQSPIIVTPTIASFANANHTHQNSAGGGTLDAAAIAAGTVATARLGSGTANTTTFLRGDQSYAQPVENSLNLSDNTTNNASTSKHGFLLKLDNNAAHYMDGTGAWSSPSGSGANWTSSGSTNSSLTGDAYANSGTFTNGVTTGSGIPGGIVFSGGDTTITNNATNTLTFSGGTAYNFDAGSTIDNGTSGVLKSGTVELGHATDTTVSRGGAGQLLVEGVQVVMPASTNTFTNKTFDSQATGNVLKWIDYDKWVCPQLADETGAIITTNNAASELNGHATFSGSAATNANWVVYEWTVPDDIDTAVDLKVSQFKFTTAGTSTSAATFNIGMQDVADSADAITISLANFSNWVQMTKSPTSTAANDVFSISAVTLTNWKSSITAGHTVHILINRDGAGDANNDALTDKWFQISYGRTQ